MNEETRKKMIASSMTAVDALKDNKLSKDNESSDKIKNDVIGYFINFGVTSCRLFEILNKKKGLIERKVISYDITDPSDSEYFSGIILHVKNEILPYVNKCQNPIFLKTFADACFSEVFINEAKRNEFIMDFYNETSLFFNILSQRQTEENLRMLFNNIVNHSDTAIVNIGSQYIEILVKHNNKFDMYNLKLTLNDISSFIEDYNIPEIWNKSIIYRIKKYINSIIKDNLKNIKAKNVVIIKDELKFMEDLGYPLIFRDGSKCISIDDYKRANKEFLFGNDYQKEVESKYSDQATIKRMYGFKNGHIILETIFDCIGAETVIPSDELSIHGSLNAYIFNVVISGSSNGDRADYMLEAHRIMTKMGATVLSPRIVNGKLSKQTPATDVKHASAIRECDLLFISNKDGYIGNQTGREIYGAYLLNKPIAFWKEPEDAERLEYIPHEKWWNLMRYLENDND